MDFVHDHDVAALQQYVVYCPSQQRAHRDELNRAGRGRRPHCGTMHGVAHGVAELLAPFPGDALGHGDRGDAARLGHHYSGAVVTWVLSHPVVHQKLRQLGGLPTAGAARNHDNLRIHEGLSDFFAECLHRQLPDDFLAPRVLALRRWREAQGLGYYRPTRDIIVLSGVGAGGVHFLGLCKSVFPRLLVAIHDELLQKTFTCLPTELIQAKNLACGDATPAAPRLTSSGLSQIPGVGPLNWFVRIFRWNSQIPAEAADENLPSQGQGNLLVEVCRRSHHPHVKAKARNR
mmetsp:Transcript_37706/g.68230  ORF Transcript_37706/g.68230 Transcript_37706/m.68230 type:complete len:289 (-) Transcript_37706:399-1265(-)